MSSCPGFGSEVGTGRRTLTRPTQTPAAGPLPRPGQIVVLNGVPRAGKSSIAAVIQETFDGPWINLGVDVVGFRAARRTAPGLVKLSVR